MAFNPLSRDEMFRGVAQYSNIGKKVRNQHFFVPNFNVIGSKSYLVLRKTESKVSKKISNVFGQTKKVYIDFSFGWSPTVRIFSFFFQIFVRFRLL